MTVVVLGFTVYGIATGSSLSLPYAAVIVAGSSGRPRRARGWLQRGVVAGLTLWAIGHLAGGTVAIGDNRTLSNAVLPGGIHADNVVHFIGFPGLAWWEAGSPWLHSSPGHRLGVAVTVWLRAWAWRPRGGRVRVHPRPAPDQRRRLPEHRSRPHR